MKYFILIYFLIYLLLNCQIVKANPKKPLSLNETNIAISIIQSLYNISLNDSDEICDYNGCFECKEIDINRYVITSIKMLNSLNNFIVFQDLSVFEYLSELQIGENVQLPSSFYNNTLNSLSLLRKLKVSYQGHPFPDKFILPKLLTQVEFSLISVPLNSNWFEYYVNTFSIYNSLAGFEYQNFTNQYYNLMVLVLPLNYINSDLPPMKQFINLEILILKIYNDMSVQGYNNFTINSINQDYYKLNYLEVSFINSGNDATIQKFPLQQSLLSKLKFTLRELYLFGIGFNIDPIVGYLDFTIMSNYNFKLTIKRTCDLVNQCMGNGNNSCIIVSNDSHITISGCPTSYSTKSPSTTSVASSTNVPVDGTTSAASSLSFSNCLFLIGLYVCYHSFKSF
ncbi:hypothetical protein ACTFIZ_010850 [Dictyostelium cf. discoideum]